MKGGRKHLGEDANKRFWLDLEGAQIAEWNGRGLFLGDGLAVAAPWLWLQD